MTDVQCLITLINRTGREVAVLVNTDFPERVLEGGNVIYIRKRASGFSHLLVQGVAGA